ncbi:uncharacterized protein [Onthophagus taurus]|uniref:uncharacterized protein n=1 Tax=Onthophagus taurus TaxID=166361 RepID=UPI0039BE8C7E
MDEILKEMSTLNMEESTEEDKIVKTALKILKKTTEMIEKNYTDPKQLFNDLIEADLRYFLTTDIEINRMDLKGVLEMNDLFPIVTKCVTKLFEHTKNELGKKDLSQNEIIEVVGTIANLTLIMEISNFKTKDIQKEIEKFLVFLFRFFFNFDEINKFNLLILCEELILEFTNRHESRLFILIEIKNRFETIKNTQILTNFNISDVLSGIEIECFMHYANILREVLEKNWFTPNGNNKKIPKEILNDLNKILIELKPYLTRSLKFVFDNCSMYLI